MIEADAAPRDSQSLRRGRGALAENPTAVAIGVYASLAIVAVVAAYLAIFTEFAPYDDEGTLLVTVKAFVNGGTLYRDIWSVYGPFYYEVFGGLFALSGHAVTTDASRTIVIVVWVGTSMLFGVATQRLTGRLALGAAAMVAAFAALGILVNEPMHPEGLCALLLAAIALVLVCSLTGRTGLLGGVGCGALLAALVLTKVNLGVFALAGILLAAALTVEPLARRAWLRWLVPIVFLAMPAFVLARDLGLSWVREMLVLEVLAGLALIVAAWPLRPPRGEDDGGLLRWLFAALAGFIVALLLILGVVLLTGPSPADVYEGVLTQVFRIRDVLVIQFPFPPGSALDWAVVAVGVAALASRWRGAGNAAPALWPGLLRTLAGLAIWLSVAHVVPIGLNPSSANPVVIPMLLAWVIAIPPAAASEPPQRQFLRVALAALAIAETLQVYPVAGSQMGIASVPFIVVGALCFADALVALRAWSESRGVSFTHGLAAIVSAASIGLGVILGLNAIVMPAASNAVAYHNQPRLPLPGAELLHLPAPAVETYTELVDLLHRHRCTTFVGYPTINSLYLWSGLEAPGQQMPNGWVYSLSKSQEHRALAGFRASPHPCEIRNEELAPDYLRGEPPPNFPLVRYVLNDFKPVATVGPFEFLVPRPGAGASD